MNKILSQAIKKAVSEYSSNNTVINIEENKQKRPDLFSLSDNTELFQNSKGITIKIDRSKDIKNIVKNLHCLKVNSSGEPSHPLYLKADLKPIKYN